ncbi:MAG: chemotaxis protein CheW [Kofleriaceae bacterium]
MTDHIDLQEFVGAFVVESEELVAVANAALLEVEAANATNTLKPRAVRDLFRALHTIKGLAGMIGVEPIVEIAHGLETLIRTADRAGGVLGKAAVDVSLRGVAAIAERVQAVARGETPAPAPVRLVEAIEQADAKPTTVVAPPAVVTEWDSRLTAGERQHLATGLASGQRAWKITFVPSEDNAAKGVTIATVRARVMAIGEIVKVLPRATPGAAASLAFDLLVVSTATPAALADAGATTEAELAEVVAPAAAPAATSEPAIELDELVAAPGSNALGRGVVRVELARLDDLQEQLSLLTVSRFRLERELAMLAEHGTDVRRIREVATLQGRQLRDLRRAILRARMVRVAEVLEPLPLLVRSLTRGSPKEVRLELDTRDAELDKAVADRLLPALVHLVRNAVDHAIETPDERVASGKSRAGTVRVTCSEEGANRIAVVVEDDGRGIDRETVGRRSNRSVENDAELLDVITTPGFSTRTEATRTSGRGLGMDIVRRIAVNELGGELALATTLGAGSRFTLRVPLTIAVVDVFSFECGPQAFVVPVSMVEEIFELAPDQIMAPPASREPRIHLLERRGRALPLLSLGVVLAIDSGAGARKAMVVRQNGEAIGFTVDRMLGRHEVVVRPIDDPLVSVPGVAGATDLGDGQPTLVLDLAALGARVRERRMS